MYPPLSLRKQISQISSTQRILFKILYFYYIFHYLGIYTYEFLSYIFLKIYIIFILLMFLF